MHARYSDVPALQYGELDETTKGRMLAIGDVVVVS
jgi:hypothetical protein